jgi:hypothetical protein
MKTPNRKTRSNSDAGSCLHWGPSISHAASGAENSRVEPAVPHRRYPSLSEDFEDLFHRPPGTRTRAAKSADLAGSDEGDPSPVAYVRIIALLIIVAILATLAVNA